LQEVLSVTRRFSQRRGFIERPERAPGRCIWLHMHKKSVVLSLLVCQIYTYRPASRCRSFIGLATPHG
jgi:hypothetical protein